MACCRRPIKDKISLLVAFLRDSQALTWLRSRLSLSSGRRACISSVSKVIPIKQQLASKDYLTVQGSQPASGQISDGGTCLHPVGMGSAFLTTPPRTTSLLQMRQGPGVVVGSLDLNGYNWLGRRNGHGGISWQRNWYQSS